ncbi:MAG: hypothetical protein ACI9TO_000634, partial [Rickettsiales bacterium]
FGKRAEISFKFSCQIWFLNFLFNSSKFIFY